jgi:hypothetical protein
MPVRAGIPSPVLVLEGAGAFMPLKRAAEGVAFRHGHFLGRKMKVRG